MIKLQNCKSQSNKSVNLLFLKGANLLKNIVECLLLNSKICPFVGLDWEANKGGSYAYEGNLILYDSFEWKSPHSSVS